MDLELLRRGRLPVRVLTLWQPWASLVAFGAKRLETRSWTTGYRGLVAIHSARTTIPLRALEPELRPALHRNGLEDLERLPLGQVLGLVELVEVLSTGSTRSPAAWVRDLPLDERLFGNFAPGRFGWRLVPVATFERPIPHRGSQGFPKAPTSLLLELAAAAESSQRKAPQ